MRTRSVLPALTLTALLALAGCGSDETGDPPAPGSAVEDGAGTLQVRPVAASPTAEQQSELDEIDCAAERPTALAEEPMVACDAEGTAYALEPAVVDGGVDRVDQSEDTGGDVGDWAVQLTFDPEPTRELAAVTEELAGTGQQLAIVFEGEVLAAPTVEEPLTDGQVQISNSYSQGEATDLGNRIQAGG